MKNLINIVNIISEGPVRGLNFQGKIFSKNLSEYKTLSQEFF
jgi:hypothetical protein